MVASFPPPDAEAPAPSPRNGDSDKCQCCCCCKRSQSDFSWPQWLLGWVIGAALGTAIAQAFFKPWYAQLRGHSEASIVVESFEAPTHSPSEAGFRFVPRTCTGAEVEPCAPGGDWVCASSDCVDNGPGEIGGSDDLPAGDTSDCGIDQPCGNW